MGKFGRPDLGIGLRQFGQFRSSLYQALLLRPLLENPRPSHNHSEWAPLNSLSVTLIRTASLALLVL